MPRSDSACASPGLNREDRVQIRHGAVGIALGKECPRAKRPRHGIVRRLTHHLIERNDGAIELARCDHRKPAAQKRGLVGRILFENVVEIRQALGGIALVHQGQSAGGPRVIVEPLQRQGLVVVGQGLVDLAHREIGLAALGVRAALGGDRDRTIEIGNGLSNFPSCRLMMPRLECAVALLGFMVRALSTSAMPCSGCRRAARASPRVASNCTSAGLSLTSSSRSPRTAEIWFSFRWRKKAHPQRELVARIGGEHLIQQHDRIAVFGLSDELLCPLGQLTAGRATGGAGCAGWRPVAAPDRSSLKRQMVRAEVGFGLS